MLDRSKLMQAMHEVSSQIFTDHSAEFDLAFKVWQQIAQDPAFAYKARASSTPLNVPAWIGKLDAAVPLNPAQTYRAIAVDGSQIYPDRHQGLGCYLINIGCVVIHYGMQGKGVLFNSQPHFFVGEGEEKLPVTPDFVNCRRDAFEFREGHALSAHHAQSKDEQLLLFDGALIFWHLAAKEVEFQRHFIEQYLATLNDLFKSRLLCASYISLPKNKELSNLIRLALCNFDASTADAFACIEHVLDAAVAQFYLKPHERSAVFAHTSALAALYPDHLKPHFIYLHNGTEIARIEVPAWIARDESLVDQCAAIILDQCIKGSGYPVVLAEAHEQAVVKGTDREFFYHLLAKIGIESKHRITMSQKSLKKRGIGI